MKKWIVAIIVLFWCTGCDMAEFGAINDPFVPVHMRNMSTISGVTVFLNCGYDRPENVTCYLDPSPQSGMPVDRDLTVSMLCDIWWVERAVDSVVIDSGSIALTSEKWLLIEGSATGWTCTWSDTGWD
ncbi:hypothetical protein AMJ83_10420 [candidate division WOR_3 bacterium SM23_42]|uniref:Ig-like domain-containing protein n=1 Tax=candidate division WOR_3 bacterium SM23_42 TaxID=1703779 RepID=A0A0S8FSN9_UNCW3|nr:MAG: hypothetical protein AMJ83_10420 [candidate division WOR_3 bacterium SM23_42]